MLSVRTILSREGVTISDVSCRHPSGRGEAESGAGSHMVVFVRRGCFVRHAAGADALLDSSVAYCVNPFEEQRYDHPQPHGDDCTSLGLDDALLGSLLGSSDRLPYAPLRTSASTDLEHRLLLAAARRADDQHELVERALALVAATLARDGRPPVPSARPAIARAHRRLADNAREALSADPDRSLSELAQTLAVSPSHLSRVFRSVTGQTLARHRLRTRARCALERLAGGERDLARLAAETGFADQSHLCRVIRAETGSTPLALAGALGQRAPALTGVPGRSAPALVTPADQSATPE